jgi:hypothetical protein
MASPLGAEASAIAEHLKASMPDLEGKDTDLSSSSSPPGVVPKEEPAVVLEQQPGTQRVSFLSLVIVLWYSFGF